MPHNNTTKNTQNNPTVTTDNNLFILLCAPSHDDLTEYTSKLFENFPNLGAPTELCKIESPLKYDQLLSQLPIDSETTDVALIFCGHGEPSSLQGPGAHPGALNYRKTFSSFYDDSFIHLRPKFMLAFCCSAAAGLGDSYERKTTGCTFVGFNLEIGFIKRGGVYANWWREILHGSASAMLSADIDLEEAIRELYKDAISCLSPANKKKYKWWLMMRMYLRGQLEALSVIQT